MRKLFLAGNWKMNLDGCQCRRLAGELKAQIGMVTEVDLAVCPPFVYLPAVAEALAGSTVALGAQNIYPEDGGAFTGEISPQMLLDVGCRYVIVGHSERRHVIGETDGFISQKVRKALDSGLKPIVCVGEKLQQRRDRQTEQVVSAQVRSALKGVAAEQMAVVTIAYEPVWAIGTGENATPDQAQQVHEVIRALVRELYDEGVARSLVIQYGGSVKPDNAADLLSMADVDGALVGGASLKPETFIPIAKEALALRAG